MGKLNDVTIKAAKEGRLQDGDGLFLLARPTGAKFWLLRVMKDGKRSEIGLGKYAEPRSRSAKPLSDSELLACRALSLSDARAKARLVRHMAKSGINVVAEKKIAKAQAKEANDRTFEKVAELAYAARKERPTRTSAIWLSRLERYAFPHFGHKPVDQIDGPMVIKALEPIWNEKPETSRRVYRAIAKVLRFAHARQWRGPAPNLPDLLKEALPAHDEGVKHHPAVDYRQAPAAVAELQSAAKTMGRRALLFTIFTAVRSCETRLARWGEINLNTAEWTIGAERMKMKREHVVPLSPAATAILKSIATEWHDVNGIDATIPSDSLVFPGTRAGRPISDMTMSKAHKLVAPETTVHGWRSTIRDWAGETTDHSSDVCEASLSHKFGNATTRSYQRGTMLEKRRALMNDWSAYVMPTPADETEKLVDLGDQDPAN